MNIEDLNNVKITDLEITSDDLEEGDNIQETGKTDMEKMEERRRMREMKDRVRNQTVDAAKLTVVTTTREFNAMMDLIESQFPEVDRAISAVDNTISNLHRGTLSPAIGMGYSSSGKKFNEDGTVSSRRFNENDIDENDNDDMADRMTRNNTVEEGQTYQAAENINSQVSKGKALLTALKKKLELANAYVDAMKKEEESMWKSNKAKTFANMTAAQQDKMKERYGEDGIEDGAHSDDYIIISQRNISVSKKFRSYLSKYQSMQLDSCNEVESRVKRIIRSVCADMEEQTLDKLLSSSGKNTMLMEQALSARSIEARQRLYDAVEKHALIKQATSVINEIYEMSLNMAALVEEQTHTLEQITQQVHLASSNVVQGVESLTQANVYMKKAGKKKCCLLFILLGVVAAVVIILGTTLGIFKK